MVHAVILAVGAAVGAALAAIVFSTSFKKNKSIAAEAAPTKVASVLNACRCHGSTCRSGFSRDCIFTIFQEEQEPRG
jgi:hypothetical protein